jgi:hypothetical protein
MQRNRCRQANARSLVLAVLAIILVGSDRSTAQDTATVSSFQLSPGIVVNLTRHEAYVTSPEGGIVAVNLDKGTQVWRTSEAVKPLALAGGLLVSQAEPAGARNELKIVALDATEGHPVIERSVQLPAGVMASIGQTQKGTFSAEARPVGGDATVSWEYAERLVQGIRPGGPASYLGEATPSTEPRAPAPAPPGSEPEQQATRGTFRIDLQSGDITPEAPAPKAAPSPQALDLDPQARLAGIPAPQFVSMDGRHILSSHRIADDTVWEKYLWEIYDRDTGQHLGQFRTHVRVAPFFVLDSRVVYETSPYARLTPAGAVEEQPRQIRAVDLQTGRELWSQPVRETIQRAAPPPG